MIRVRITTEGGRSDTEGRFDQRIYSLSERRRVRPAKTRVYTSGYRWTHVWYLSPGDYLETDVDISEDGTHHCGCRKLSVKENGEYTYTRWEGELPDFVDPPCDCGAFCEVIDGVEVK